MAAVPVEAVLAVVEAAAAVLAVEPALAEEAHPEVVVAEEAVGRNLAMASAKLERTLTSPVLLWRFRQCFYS